MRKLLISLGVAAAALVAASPAAAQYYPQPQPQQYGYGGYGYNNGYNGSGYGGYGQIRSLQARIDAVEYQIRMLDRRDAIGDGSADRLREDARRIESRLHRAGRDGLNPNEVNAIQGRIAQLEQRVQFARQNRYGHDRDRHDGHDRDRD
jgi:hypothetical protein